MRLLTVHLGLISCLCISSLASALTSPSYQAHDIERTSKNTFLIQGNDPYILFSPLFVGTNEAEAKHLSLNFQLESGSLAPDSVAMELFFKPITLQANSLFDPNYRIRFSVPKAHLNSDTPRFVIALPENWQAADTTKSLRLDINGCSTCRFQALSYPSLLSTSQEPSSTLTITPSEVFNGLIKLEADGLNITSGPWLLNDLTRTETKLTQRGGDPFIVSTPLELSTEQFGGVYIRLRSEADVGDAQDFQLFYATESHGFIEQASTSLRVSPNTDNQYEFVVPLSFLSSEQPPAHRLSRLRLDLDGRSGDTEKSWVLENFELLHSQKLKAKIDLIPGDRITNKRQRARGFKLVAKSLKKIGSDIGFVIGYLLLLLVSAFAIRRSYLK